MSPLQKQIQLKKCLTLEKLKKHNNKNCCDKFNPDLLSCFSFTIHSILKVITGVAMNIRQKFLNLTIELHTIQVLGTQIQNCFLGSKNINIL